jgi:hypothetical protein
MLCVEKEKTKENNLAFLTTSPALWQIQRRLLDASRTSLFTQESAPPYNPLPFAPAAHP